MISKLKHFKNKKIHIVGISGIEGAEIVRFLGRQGINHLIGHDFSTRRDFQKNFRLHHLFLNPFERKEFLDEVLTYCSEINYQDSYLEEIEKADFIFVGQGWMTYQANYPRLKKIFKTHKEKFFNLNYLYFLLSPGSILAVTGSNGKSTTVAMLQSIFKQSIQKGFWGGNSRRYPQPLLQLSQMKKEDWLVLEVSNRQLTIDLPRGPEIAVLTNLSPNHLDEHASYGNYLDTKKKLFQIQNKDQKAILNSNCSEIQYWLPDLKAKTYFYGSSYSPRNTALFYWRENKLFFQAKEKKYLFSTSDLKVRGEHNFLNMLAAANAAFLAGICIDSIKKGLIRFKGLPGCLEYLGSKGGVLFYDDTESTTPQATLSALNSFSEPVILILGGDNKGLDLKEFGSQITPRVNKVIIIESSGGKELASFMPESNKVIESRNIEEALQKAYNEAQENEVVLVSPAMAHFRSLFLQGRKINEIWKNFYN